MTDQTNKCSDCGKLMVCMEINKKRINDLDEEHKTDVKDIYKKIETNVPWKYAFVFVMIIVVFGLILINTNANGIMVVDAKVETKINLIDKKYEAKFEKTQIEIVDKLTDLQKAIEKK